MRYRHIALIASCLLVASCDPHQDLAEQDIQTLQDLMQRGELTSRQLVDWYAARIERIDRGGLGAIIEVNPDAAKIADALDRERRESGPRGPLHGIPVVLKANIGTGDGMATSAGSLALADHRPGDAFLVSELRKAGAVILAKANLSEWANFRSSNSVSGWSSVGGQTRNPYDPRRSPCGSSSGSGVAVAANLAVLAVGTETNGSVICPAGTNGIVGIKPTLGLVSRDGIVPIAHSQDTAGPMARTVRDAAILLSVMDAIDPDDPAGEARPDSDIDYTRHLDANALSGKRIGVLRTYSGAGRNAKVEAIFEDSIRVLQAAGAEIIDPIEIDLANTGKQRREVLLYEFKADLNRYLRMTEAKLAGLSALIEFNKTNADSVMPFFGQDLLEKSQAKGPLTSSEYLEALAAVRSAAKNGIDDAMRLHRLDAIVAPSNGPAWMIDEVNGDNFSIGSSTFAAVSGYANITVPAGFVSGLPVGLSFIGGAWSEQQIIGLAYAFEQASRIRRPPELH